MLALAAASLSRMGRLVVEALDLAITPGQVTALCGPNGAGKTTALHTLAGDLAPASGCATLDGRSLDRYPPAALARRRAVLTQHSELGLAFDAERVVALAGFASARPPGNNPLVELAAASLANRAYTSLSGGEARLVQLARVLAQADLAHDEDRPATLLLDEPTSQLDLGFAERAMARLRARAERGLAVLVVMHDLPLAARHADRLVLLAERRTIADGPPAAVLDTEIIRAAYGIGAEVLPASGRRGILVVPHAPEAP